MSRIAKKPIELPKGVELSIKGREVSAKGPKGFLTVTLHDAVELTQEDNILSFAPRDSRQSSLAVTGTMRSVVNNIIEGVTNGFEKKTATGRRWLSCAGAGQATQPVARPVAPGELPGTRRYRNRDPGGHRNRGAWLRQATRRSGLRGNSRVQATRALQGQGC